jgi:hypothetical protein
LQHLCLCVYVGKGEGSSVKNYIFSLSSQLWLIKDNLKIINVILGITFFEPHLKKDPR